MTVNLALLYDDSRRPDTTGIYCLRACRELVAEGALEQVEHVRPTALSASSLDWADAVLIVDDGTSWELPSVACPVAWWAIDTHLRFDECLIRARQATLTFAAQKDGAAQLVTSGIESARWLPLACDPGLHGRRDVPAQYDVSFVGHAGNDRRRSRLDLIRQHYPDSCLGPQPHTSLAEIYSASRIVFNSSLGGDINMRVFEALASGSLLITDAIAGNGFDELFQPGRQLVTYADDEELLQKLDNYLRAEAERETIAAAGRRLVLSQHTYRHRIEAILAALVQHADDQKRNPAARPSTHTSGSHAPVSTLSDYYWHSRPDVERLVPTTCRSILDVGCGAGRLGAALKNRQPVYVVGIDRNPAAVDQARHVLDEAIAGDIEELPESLFETERFDGILCADVLEHLKDPETVLRKLRRWLSPDGRLVTSVPNVQNQSVIRSLLAGNWTYESAGLLDDDHLRFFTRRELEKLLFRAGFESEELRSVYDSAYGNWISAGRPDTVVLGNLRIDARDHKTAEEFFTYQYLTRSRIRQTIEFGTTSVIIPVHNQLACTRQCLDSLRRRTLAPVELIIVDNGSTDGTAEFLARLEGVTVIRNETNRGFPAAVNQGLDIATGQNVLLLNNDTVLTTGWLTRLLEVLYSEDSIGLVGPVSNCVSGPQQVDVNYTQLAELDGYAWDHHNRFSHEALPPTDIERLVGFCLLMKRDVLDDVGLLDEQFGIGCFEDDDFCRRAIRAGYRCVVARNVFVHHIGSATFRSARIDHKGLMEQNHKRFRQKWGTQPDADLASDTSDVATRTPRLSLCMIVRDNEPTIEAALHSIRPWVDELIVVDTGSSDRTPEICRKLGAAVYRWDWQEDFAAARNESLGHATGDWVVWMDSDDTIAEDQGRKLRALVDGPHDEQTLGYVLQVRCPGCSPHDVTVVDHVKLIRNRPDLRFEFRIHEQILPAIRRAGGRVEWTDVQIDHSGSDRSPGGRQKKLARDLRLLELELADRPDHPFTLFNLGMTYVESDRHDEAVDVLRQCLARSATGESHLRKAHALLVGALTHLQQHEAAWNACQAGLDAFPEDPELLFRAGLLNQHFGRLAEAEAAYRRVLDERPARFFASVDVGMADFKARHNLALVYESQECFDAAARQWRLILQSRPDYAPAGKGLIECLFHCEPSAAEEAARELQQTPKTRCWGLLLAARIAEQRNIPGQWEQLLETALLADPGNLEVHREMCRFLFTQPDRDATAAAIERLVELDQEDAAAWHNLGLVRLQLGQNQKARSAFGRSLELRPDATHTRAWFDRLQSNDSTAPASEQPSADELAHSNG